MLSFERIGSWLLVGLSAVLVLSCNAPDPGPEVKVESYRLIVEDPESEFDALQALDSITVQVWTLGRGGSAPDWELESPKSGVDIKAEGGLVVQTQAATVTFVNEANLEAAGIDFFDVEVGGISREKVTLAWTPAGVGECDDCFVELDSGERRGQGPATYRFAVADNLSWNGSVERLHLTFDMPRSGRVVLNRIEGLKTKINQEKVTSVAAHAWKIDLANDLRNAVVAVPGHPSELKVDKLHSGAEVEFGYGVYGSRGRFRFRVEARLGSGEVTELFSGEALPEQGWIEGSVPVGPELGLDGEAVTFSFAAERLDSSLRGPPSFGVWSNPVVLGSGRDARPNVVMISIDTLRSDRMSLYGYHHNTTPELERWAGERGAVVFENAVAPAPWTLPSHVSMMTGLDAITHGVNYGRRAAGSLNMMAEYLREAGYTTAGITGGGFVHPQWGFAQGFDTYSYFATSMGFEDELEKGVERASDWLDSVDDRRFFLFFHTYEVHNPFRPRRPFFGEFSNYDAGYSLRIDHVPPSEVDGFLTRRAFSLRVPGQKELVSPVPEEYQNLASDLYDAGVGYMDQQVARLLAKLDDIDLNQPTIVIFTSDHGEMLGEHGLINHACLYEENIMVPLVIADPRHRRSELSRVVEQVSLVDLLPTVLESLGITARTALDGESLLPLVRGEASEWHQDKAWSYAPGTNYGVSLRVGNKDKYIFKNHIWNSEVPKKELFNLSDDPGESTNVVQLAEQTAVVEQMHQTVAERFRMTQRDVRLRLFNFSDGAMEGQLKGAFVNTANLKSNDAPPDRIAWSGEAVTLRIMSGDDIGIWAEEAANKAVWIELAPAHGRGPIFRENLRCEDLEGPSVVILEEGQWQVRSADSAPVEGTMGLAISCAGETAHESGDSPIDKELREQLEALGYAH